MGYTPAVTPYNVTTGAPSGLAPNNYIPAGNGYVSEVEGYTIYDRPIPERTWLFDRHVGYMGFATMLSSMGFTNGSDTPTVGHYESPWREDVVKVGAIVTPAVNPGDPEVWELHSDSMYDTGATSGGTSVETSYVQENDVIELYNRKQVFVSAKDTSVTPHQITVTPLKAAVNIAGDVTVDDEYGIGYNLFAESTDLPKGRAPRIITYNNTFGLNKHAFGATGFELTNAVYHEVIPGDEGSARQPIYIRIKVDELKRYEMTKSNMLLFGQVPDNITQLVTETNLDTPVGGTEGLIDFALTNGAVDTYTVGSYALDDFNAMANIYYDERSTTTPDIITWDGPGIATETEDLFQATLTNDLTPFVDRFIPGYTQYMTEGYHEGLDHSEYDANLAFGYTAIKKNGLVFHMKRLSELNDVKRFGGQGYAYRNYRIAMPIGWTTDAISGNSRPTVGYEYKQLGNYSRENVFGHFAGAGVGGSNTPFGPASNGVDSMKYFLISHCAGHWALGNGCVVQIPA